MCANQQIPRAQPAKATIGAHRRQFPVIESRQGKDPQSEAPAPLYLIVGDDPLLVQEAADKVRRAAREHGLIRKSFHATTDFDWQTLLHSGDNLSLFGDRQLIEMNVPGGKPGVHGARVLSQLAARPPDHDTVMVIVADALSWEIAKAAWARALKTAGHYVAAWKPKEKDLPEWIRRRMQGMGLQADRAAASLLAERVEGNLVAAVQEMEKLLLLRGPGAVDERAISAVVTDSARFDVFQLSEAALSGRPGRAIRILRGLQEESVPAPLVMWALSRDLLEMCQLAAGARPRMAPVRANQLRPTARRLGTGRCRQLLIAATRADAVSKGQLHGDTWAQIADVVLGIAGADQAKRRGVAGE